MSRIVLLACVTLIAGALAACGASEDEAPQRSDFKPGASQEELLSRFGEPKKRQQLVKSDERVWGPIESFWTTLATGTKIEIWSYETAGGRAELYFIDGADVVHGVGFAPEGAVF